MNFDALDSYESDLALVLEPMPPEKRAQVLAEVRAHLEAMIEARRADGMSAQSAMENAMGIFGAADEIGRELLDEWARGPRMEVRGTPLSKREKCRQIALMIVWPCVVFPLFQWLQQQIHGWQWEGMAESAFVILCFTLGMWRSQRSGRWLERPVYRFTAVVNMVHIMFVVIHFNRSAMPFSAQSALEIWMPIYGVCSLIGLVWWLRERKTNPPWRYMTTYQANPVATEERYRLKQNSGLIISGAVITLSALWLNWNLFGLIYGVAISLVLLGLYTLLYRWIR